MFSTLLASKLQNNNDVDNSIQNFSVTTKTLSNCAIKPLLKQYILSFVNICIDDHRQLKLCNSNIAKIALYLMALVRINIKIKYSFKSAVLKLLDIRPFIVLP